MDGARAWDSKGNGTPPARHRLIRISGSAQPTICARQSCGHSPPGSLEAVPVCQSRVVSSRAIENSPCGARPISASWRSRYTHAPSRRPGGASGARPLARAPGQNSALAERAGRHEPPAGLLAVPPLRRPRACWQCRLSPENAEFWTCQKIWRSCCPAFQSGGAAVPAPSRSSGQASRPCARKSI